MRATLSVPIDRLARAGLIALALGFVAACGGGGGGGSSGGGAAPAVVAAPAPAPVAPPPVVAPVVAPVVVAPVVVPPVPVGVSPNITLALNASRLTGVAPLAVTFDAIGTTASSTSLPFHEVRYSWNFGETARNPAYNATWAYGTRPGANSKDVALGPVAAHVFETPGTYTVSLTGFDGTNTSTRTTTVTVTDPNTVFSNNTIYISQSGVPVPGQNGVPPGANVQHVPSWATVQTLAQTYKRILLKRGDVWPVVSTVTFGASQAGPGVIGAYGSGNKPIIRTDTVTPLRLDASANDWRVVDLTVTSTDLVTSTAGGVVVFNAQNTLLLRTDVNRVGRLVLEVQGANGYYLVDSVIGPASANGSASINLYGANTDRIGVLGSRFTGGRDHGIRIGGTATSVFSNLRIDNGRTGSHTMTIRGKSLVSTPWNGLWTEHVVVSDNALEGVVGSIAALALKPVNADNAERLRRVIVERNLIDAPNSEPIFAQVSEELTIRNNILTTGYGNGIAFGASSNVGSPLPSSGWVYNNTIYKGNTTYSSGLSAVFVVSGVTGYDIKNNIAYAPGSTSPAMFGGSGVEGVNYTQSNNSSNAQILSTRPWAAVTPSNAVDFTPSGSYVVGAGTNVRSWTDYFGNPFSSPMPIGAVNP